MIYGKWSRTSALLAIFLWFPAQGLADGACGCEELCNLENRLKERERLLEAARQVAKEAKEKSFPTSAWAKERFIEIAFPGGNYKVEGVQAYGEEPKVAEEHKKSNCDSVWKATEAHEQDHANYDKTVPNWKYPWIMIFGQEGEFLAGKEASGYAAEVQYLLNEIEKLRRNCPQVECKPPGPKPQIERYQEQNKAYRREQKERLDRAARRVAQYAGSIR